MATQKIKIVQSASLKKDVSLPNTSLMNEAVCLYLSDSLYLLVSVASALIIGEHNLCLYTLYLKLIQFILLADAVPLPFKHTYFVHTYSSRVILYKHTDIEHN